MYTLARADQGSEFKLGTLESAHNPMTSLVIPTSINTATADFVQNRPKGIRHGVPDPTRLYMPAVPSFEPGNSIRNVGMFNPGGDASDGLRAKAATFTKTPSMLCRKNLVYELLFTKNQQGFPYDDWGTYSTAYTGMDLSKLRPGSVLKWT